MAPVKGGSSSSLVELMKTSMNAVTGGGTEPRLPLAKLISRIQRTPSGGISGEQVGITRGGASVHPRAVGLTGMRLACVWGNVRRCWTSGRRWWSAPSCCSCFPSPTTQPSSQCFRSVRGSLNCGRGKTGVARSARWGGETSFKWVRVRFQRVGRSRAGPPPQDAREWVHPPRRLFKNQSCCCVGFPNPDFGTGVLKVVEDCIAGLVRKAAPRWALACDVASRLRASECASPGRSGAVVGCLATRVSGDDARWMRAATPGSSLARGLPGLAGVATRPGGVVKPTDTGEVATFAY